MLVPAERAALILPFDVPLYARALAAEGGRNASKDRDRDRSERDGKRGDHDGAAKGARADDDNGGNNGDDDDHGGNNKGDDEDEDKEITGMMTAKAPTTARKHSVLDRIERQERQDLQGDRRSSA